jgi:CubicO group peptidase (beta-lactamase class C family)
VNTDAQRTFDQLCAFVEKTMKRRGIPGVAVGVLCQGKTDTAGFGVTNVDHSLPVTDETLFQIGSITKTFTSLAVMRLVEQGKLDLDATVRTYLPGFCVADETASAQATVRHLLIHTAGWAGDLFLDTGPGDDASAKYVAKMADLQQLAPLGAVWSYNNASFYLVGHLIEQVTDETYEQALKDLVLEPLELEHCYLDPGDVMTHRFAVGHHAGADGAEVARPWPLPRAARPAGGLICDVKALLRYA